MNKNPIKNYAIWARNELITRVTQKAFEYGVSKENIVDFNAESVNGKLLTVEEKQQRQKLISEVKEKGFDQVMEEVAYTWFNRFIALRYMEVNNYLPNRVRVFTNENNEFKPQLLDEAATIELDGLDKEKVYELLEANKNEELYKTLLLATCNDMHQYLPGMFETIHDYKVLLFPENLLRNESVLGRLIFDIDEDSWLDQVQIIGWMYQYYNSELKDIVMKKKSYSKEDIPAATQLFTPDWIVRYLVENSLGKLWIDGHPESETERWKYYIKEPTQVDEVTSELKKLALRYKNINPEEITLIDPCMGSGHILVYAFEVFMDIYLECGYSSRDAAKNIIEHNIYGAEIDSRAYQLAYFALMMKARAYDRRILYKQIKHNLVEIKDSKTIDINTLHYLMDYKDIAVNLISIFSDAKELGSLIKVDIDKNELIKLKDYCRELERKINDYNLIERLEIDELLEKINPILDEAICLAGMYDVVVTNPPYMAPTPVQKPYVNRNYPNSKSDLFAVFIERCHEMNVLNGYQSMIVMPSLLFLSSFSKLREMLLDNVTINSLLHMGRGIFGIDFGSTAFTLANNKVKNYKGQYYRLHERTFQYIDPEHIKYLFLEAKRGSNLRYDFKIYDTENIPVLSKKEGNKILFVMNQNDFKLIPGVPLAYWTNDGILSSFIKGIPLGNLVIARNGMKTGKNDEFTRLWFEVDYNKEMLNALNLDEAIQSGKKWYPYNKGGDARKWYGNNDYVVNWENRGDKIFNKAKEDRRNVQNYPDEMKFSPCVTWSLVSSGEPTFRYKDNCISDIGGMSLYQGGVDTKYYLAFCNSKISSVILKMLAPTINFQAGDIARLPILFDKKEIVNEMANSNIELTKQDWDSFETSWNFKKHPLIKKTTNIRDAFCEWSKECENRFIKLKDNEEHLNKIFIAIYNLQNEMSFNVDDDAVTVRKADLNRDIKSFISYAIGCMFGRYSLNVEGLVYAGGEWDNSKYSLFTPDKDNIIPICDDEYFEDDIVSRFVEFVKAVYGEDTLEENLKYIASSLGGKGTPREVLRNYFLNDFFKDHCNTYQVTGSGKRPIYWLFDSGKKNGFKALVYIHRYTPDLIARMRTQYIHEQQARYRNQIEMLERQIDGDVSTSERVRLNKQLKKFKEQDEELRKYEEKIHHWADRMEPMDLDDGVKANYAKFQELLAKIK